MAVTQDRMLTLLIPANKLVRTFTAIKFSLKKNLSEEIALARQGDASALIDKVMFIQNIIEEADTPELLEFIALASREEDHFRKNYSRNTRAAILSDSKRRENGIAQREHLSAPPVFISSTREALFAASQEKHQVYSDVGPVVPVAADDPGLLKVMAELKAKEADAYVPFSQRPQEERDRILAEEKEFIEKSKAEKLRQMTDPKTGEVYLTSAKTQAELNEVAIPPGSSQNLL